MRFLTLALMVLGAVSVRGQEPPQEGSTVTETVETVVEQADHEVVKANTLWDLAKHFYKDPFQWRRIYEANKDQIRDPHWIYPNQVLIIPGFDRSVRVVKTQAAPEKPPVPAVVEPVALAPAVVEPPAPVVEPPAPSVVYQPNRAAGSIPLPESLSTRFPAGMTGGEPSVYRMLMPEGWKALGRIVGYGGREAIAAVGDEVRLVFDYDVKVKVRKGTRFTVWRPSGPTEADIDQKAIYAQKIGVVEATKRIGEQEYRALVVHSGGPVVVDDLITMGE